MKSDFNSKDAKYLIFVRKCFQWIGSTSPSLRSVPTASNDSSNIQIKILRLKKLPQVRPKGSCRCYFSPQAPHLLFQSTSGKWKPKNDIEHGSVSFTGRGEREREREGGRERWEIKLANPCQLGWSFEAFTNPAKSHVVTLYLISELPTKPH